ncbi:Rha family transcriptional regulator [Deefgea piscis]|uniref:Rha family transcriptional regulator n=1 Tax=Deefgea piscis TaxID=2739061 RepID=UPI001C80949E|nr:Rha family transcriptional regulator [Deefgea piscis]QZA80276.1 Rha family transcriptional regulator [Deefgea piscis]
MSLNTLTSPDVSIINGKPVTTSKAIAAFFHKLHKNVLRDIEALKADLPADFYQLNFEPIQIDANLGLGRTRKDPAYQITRDGFTLLAMGFTGKEALAWKVQYIKTFNAMEDSLRPLSIVPPEFDDVPANAGPLYQLTERQIDLLVVSRLTQQINAENAICAATAACAPKGSRDIDEQAIHDTLKKVATGLFAVNEPVGAAFFAATERLLSMYRNEREQMRERFNQAMPKVPLNVLRKID